jgi:hypothetical protein
MTEEAAHPRQAILVSDGPLTTDERRTLKFVEWMGVPTKTIVLGRGSAPTREALAPVYDKGLCLLMSAETLARARQRSPRRLHHFVGQAGVTLLVFGWGDSRRHCEVLSWLTKGAVRGVRTVAPGTHGFELPSGQRGLSRAFAGLSFSATRSVSAPAFESAIDGDSTGAVMLVNRRPMFMRVPISSSEIFLLAGPDVPDIDEPLSRETGLEAYYDRLIPLLVFLRDRFGEMCWHGPASTARVIIDDPLLADRYGFLDYQVLRRSMLREAYGTSIAFIPWNYRRTSRRMASSLLNQHADLSICVHGCDHTNREFDSSDRPLLEWKAGLAVERMRRHQARTGLQFEDVMVFPQGWFSRDAILALRATNYLAAVGTTCFPTDCGPTALTIADFLRPAITRFHGFPLFQRRYPRRLVDFSLDIFLGRPALVVEHHQYFRHGVEELETFVKGLRDLEPTLTWPTLSSQLTRSCIMRTVSPRWVEVEFFTRRYRLANPHRDRRHFSLRKFEPDRSAIGAVRVDGISVPFGFADHSLVIELDADPGETRWVEIADRARPSPDVRSMGLSYHVGVLARRGLAEFRDNALARRPRLLRAATSFARALGVTGE